MCDAMIMSQDRSALLHVMKPTALTENTVMCSVGTGHGRKSQRSSVNRLSVTSVPL